MGNHRICGFPIFIDHEKYNRNQYIFNICFIFNQNTNTCSYEAVVKKLACDLRTLEVNLSFSHFNNIHLCDVHDIFKVESAFLSNEKLKKEVLPKILLQIITDLNDYGECIIEKVGNLEHSSIFLKLIKNHLDPKSVESYDVPVFSISFEDLEIDDWDLTTKRVINLSILFLLYLFNSIVP